MLDEPGTHIGFVHLNNAVAMITEDKQILNDDPKNPDVTGNSQTENAENDRPGEQQPEEADEKQQEGGLTKEDLPDATNESTGVPGTGQRQDSN